MNYCGPFFFVELFSRNVLLFIHFNPLFQTNINLTKNCVLIPNKLLSITQFLIHRATFLVKRPFNLFKDISRIFGKDFVDIASMILKGMGREAGNFLRPNEYTKFIPKTKQYL